MHVSQSAPRSVQSQLAFAQATVCYTSDKVVGAYVQMRNYYFNEVHHLSHDDDRERGKLKREDQAVLEHHAHASPSI